MILDWVAEAVTAGARHAKACEVLGVSLRTLERWGGQGPGADQRKGPKTVPRNQLSEAERAQVLAVVNTPRFRDLSPKQIVPILTDEGTCLASEATIYRILSQEAQVCHREMTRPPAKRHRPNEYAATAPNQVWSWDITYLSTSVRGIFFHLYLVIDVFSRKIVNWSVEEAESEVYAARLMEEACFREGCDQKDVVLHADNGGPMRGGTMQATLQLLGVIPSFSRPHVKDGNPFSESLFRTVKYRPEYPQKPFDTIEEARAWVERFVAWYNEVHRHSNIRFVTPEQRHAGLDEEILAHRRRVYEKAWRKHPERWASGKIRNWEPVGVVYLNPEEPANYVTAKGKAGQAVD